MGRQILDPAGKGIGRKRGIDPVHALAGQLHDFVAGAVDEIVVVADAAAHVVRAGLAAHTRVQHGGHGLGQALAEGLQRR